MNNIDILDSYHNSGIHDIAMSGKRYVFSNNQGDYLEVIAYGERLEEVRFIHDNFPMKRRAFSTNIPYANLDEFEVDLKRMKIEIPKRK